MNTPSFKSYSEKALAYGFDRGILEFAKNLDLQDDIERRQFFEKVVPTYSDRVRFVNLRPSALLSLRRKVVYQENGQPYFLYMRYSPFSGSDAFTIPSADLRIRELDVVVVNDDSLLVEERKLAEIQKVVGLFPFIYQRRAAFNEYDDVGPEYIPPKSVNVKTYKDYMIASYDRIVGRAKFNQQDQDMEQNDKNGQNNGQAGSSGSGGGNGFINSRKKMNPFRRLAKKTK